MASGTADKVKGAVKDDAGNLTGDKRSEAEGKTDKAKGDVKNATSNVTESVTRARDSLKKEQPSFLEVLCSWGSSRTPVLRADLRRRLSFKSSGTPSPSRLACCS